MAKKLLTMFMLLSGLLYQEAQAQEMQLSLKESMQYAREHNEEIKKAGYDMLAARFQIKEARSAGLPQINASGTLVYNPKLPTQIFPGELLGMPGEKVPVQLGTDYVMQAGLEASQLLFSKSYFVGLKAARTAEELYRVRQNMAEEEVLYNVGAAYYAVLQTKQQFEVLAANQEKLNKLQDILQLQYENDLARKVDVNRLKVSRVQLENQQARLQTAYVQLLNALKFFMGMPLEQPLSLQPSESEAAELELMAGQDTSVKERAAYQVLSEQQTLSELQIANTRAGYFPSLAAFGSFTYQSQYNDQLINSDARWFNNSQLGLKLSVPVFDGLRKNAKIRQQQLELKKLETDKTRFEKNVQMELINAQAALENSRRSMAQQEESIALAQEVYQTTQDLYKEGLSPLSDLLDAEVALREAQTNKATEELNYRLAQLQLLKAGGQIETLIN